jgi:dihydropteroate synthase
MKAEVARAALRQGVTMLNDVWGLQRDAEMAAVAADHDVPVVLMHNREAADPAIDVMEDIAAFFERALVIAAAAGIRKTNIILDPGIGFGKTAAQSLTALAHLAELTVFGCPLLVGASRKRFIASVSPSEPQGRLGGSIAAHLIAAEHGAKIIRAHDVAETVQALKIASAIEASR